jgi:uncharacterized DUF497 family protein
MYADDEFEWDENKAAENYTTDGVRFETARYVFRDPFAVDWFDHRARHTTKTGMSSSAWWRTASYTSPTP